MSKKTKTVIWGARGQALVVAAMLKLQEASELVGFLDDVNPERQGQVICGKPILGGREQLKTLKDKDVRHVVLGLGNCAARLKLGKIIVDNGYSVQSLCHPSALIAPDAEIGDGTVIHAGVVVDPRCRIGRYCIINNNATVCHDSVIKDGVHVCPGVNLAGNVKVGLGSWIGIGATVIQDIKIGKGSYIGAGSVVVKDIPANVLVYGNPTHIVKRITHSF